MTPARAILIAVALPVLLYLPTLDLPHAAEWYPENSIDRVEHFRPGEILRSRPPYYRPGMLWFNQLWFHLGGPAPNPRRDRTVVLLMHAACVAMVTSLAWFRSRRAGPALTAGLFVGLHPSLVPSVTYEAVRWYVGGVVVFLLLALAGTWILAHSGPAPPRAALTGLGLLLFLLALFSEVGALAAATLGLWLLVESRPRGSAWMRWVAVPAVVSGIAYLVLRWHAFGGGFAQPYVAVEGGPLLRVRAWALGFVHEVTVVILPLRLPFLAVDGSSRAALAVAVAFCLALVLGPLLLPGVRRTLRENALASLGLSLYAALQLNGVWLQSRAPIAWEGGERSYVAYLAVVFLALLLGAVLARAADGLGMKGRRALWTCVAIFLAASLYTTREAIALVREGGEVLRDDERALTPFLRTLPQRTALAVYGFPELLRRPYLPWAYVYHNSKPLILSTWARRPLVVYWGRGEGPAPIGFDGWVVERRDGALRWRHESVAEAIETWTNRAAVLPEPDRLELLAEDTRFEDLAIDHRWPTGFEAHVTGPVPRLSREVEVDARRYGVLACEIRVEGVPPRTWRVQAYFRPRGKGTSERTAAFVEVPLDAEWRTVAIPLFAVPTWVESESVEAVRLDVAQKPVPLNDYLRPDSGSLPSVVGVRALRFESGRGWAVQARTRLHGTP